MSRPKRTARLVTKQIIESDSDDENEIKIKKPRIKKISKKDLSLVDLMSDSEESDYDDRKKKKIPKSTNKKTDQKNAKSPKKRKLVKNENSEDTKSAKRAKLKTTTDDTIDGSCISTSKSTNTKKQQNIENSVKPISRISGKSWTEPQLLSDLQNIDYNTANSIINLFIDDNTIPFICRYRKELIGDLTPDNLRDIKTTYNHIINIKAKAQSIMNNLDKENLLTEDIKYNLLCAKSLDELDHLYAPYKPASKKSLADTAKMLGLQEPAEQLLCGQPHKIDLNRLVNPKIDGLQDIVKVTNGIIHIIAYMISKDTQVLEEIRKLRKRHRIMLQSKVVKSKETKKKSTKSVNTKTEPKSKKSLDSKIFENYFDYTNNVNFVKPHQILAINRGESLKVLSVKIEIPNALKNDLYMFALQHFLTMGTLYNDRRSVFDAAFEEAYNKKLHPFVQRQIRGELTKLAEIASIEVFATNLKQLLLMSPIKGERILGIDPGFTNGCKIALISECTDLLAHDVIYPHTQTGRYLEFGERIAHMMNMHGCKLIALGNGTACRETERWISDLFKKGILNERHIKYSIVSEQGASIYSCGDIAKKEFPDLDVNLISAVSIARRLNDPLCELVKVEPKHLGVGMYQHDINEKLLSESLNEVVSECVSFVGVDINTASVTLLRHVAGLTAARAESIIKHRTENGPFKCRNDLKKVRQIGAKTFIQCAGFVRIEPLTAGSDDYNLLDSTWVHPESYDIAKNIIKKLKLSLKQIGSPNFIQKIKDFADNADFDALGSEFGIPQERIKSILDALQRELLRDYRADLEKKPLFKQGITKMSDLKEGTCVTGAITNITHFGCFVDIGVERDGLIHVSQLNGHKPNIGDRIEAIVQKVEQDRGRINLKLQKIM